MCSVGYSYRRAHVLGGGSLPVRSPVVPVDCAKLHALWSAGIARWSASRASRGFREKLGTKQRLPAFFWGPARGRTPGSDICTWAWLNYGRANMPRSNAASYLRLTRYLTSRHMEVSAYLYHGGAFDLLLIIYIALSMVCSW
jgi:hypothetical protein